MLDKRIAAKRIDSIEDLMMELELDKITREEVIPWLKNLRDDIDSFIKEYDIE